MIEEGQERRSIMDIVYRSPGELIPYAKNAKQHPPEQVKRIANSIERFGWQQPIVVDKDNVVIIGHGRLFAAKELHLEKVPVVYADNLTEEEVNALRLADNKTNESEWDFSTLEEELAALDIAGIDMTQFGFEVGEDFIDHTEITEDEPPEVPEEPKAKRGEIYRLGNHRLMCGDSTNREDVEALMDGAKADMVFTDPPYNMNYCGRGFINDGRTDNVRERIKDIIDFQANKISFLSTGDFANNIFIFTSKDLIKDYLNMFDGWSFNLLTWHKTNTPPMVNNNWFSDTEYLLYFHKGKRIWNNGLKPIDIYKKYFVTTITDAKKEAGGDLHPTIKPVSIIANEIMICSNKNGIVFDLFGGSGSTMIACEQTGRKCYMMELDPHYIDVIIQRWENLTGQKAELIQGDG